MTINLCKLSRRYALLWTLTGLMAIYLTEQTSDQMGKILCWGYAVTCLAAVWVLLRIAQMAARSTRTPSLETYPLETQNRLSSCPSRHLVDTTLVGILEATERADIQRRTPEKLSTWTPNEPSA